MNITQISSQIAPIRGVGQGVRQEEKVSSAGQPTFLDVFKSIFGEAVEGNRTVSEDRIRLMLGDADDLEQIQLNMQKAEMAVELLTNVRNTVLDSYNDIIRMQI